MADFERIVETCGKNKYGIRDRAILLTLLDTGARATELLAFNVEDVDHVMGTMTIQRGKGGKGRVVFVGQIARKAIRTYLKVRGDRPGPLFENRVGERLKYNGLRTMVRRRAGLAGLELSKIHAFRRSFTIESLRAGADLLTLQRLLGHSDLTVLKRYAKQTVDDLRAVHAATSPVDRAGR